MGWRVINNEAEKDGERRKERKKEGRRKRGGGGGEVPSHSFLYDIHRIL